MRQLTSVDAQFIAAEDGCVHGHVTGLAVYDAAGSPRGRLTREAGVSLQRQAQRWATRHRSGSRALGAPTPAFTRALSGRTPTFRSRSPLPVF